MNLTRCAVGHFYDQSKQTSCPHCSGVALAPNMQGSGISLPQNDSHDDVTVIDPSVNLRKASVDLMRNNGDAPPMQPIPKAVDDDERTLSFYGDKTKNRELVTGWLVCIGGPHYGESFKLRVGRNFIGRAQNMDVALTLDNCVSRDRHAIIAYEPRKHTFFIQAGESKELSYINDVPIIEAIIVQAGDVVLFGNTKMIFVPFCTKEHNWALYNESDI